ncbi:putative phage tail component-like protein [Natranaerovirga pectinivora]|uniref:Putative phage tail component-like protein n=1 Tax=Natranaerovirga pectinivora TaxID=682400 RepID=A0A4R3MK38_9FIRM|nr:distal tail protein Dit [Natranaerovirga pectinivora]TCT14571.1 putative phage tail component-like protein [Natranaerovirga pectinivora]
MLSFKFGNKDSYLDFGISMAKRPLLPSPSRRVTYIDIPGQSSSFRYDEKTYEDITLLVECSIKSKENLIRKIDDVKAWLFNTGESDLIFSFQPDKKYMAQVVNAIDFTQVFKYASKFPIVFNCRPFKYAVQNNPLIIVESGTTLYNPGSFESLPLLTVYGNGNINLNINNTEIQLTEVTNRIILNSEIEACYDNNHNSLDTKMNGKFPILKSGQNTISYTGNVDKIEILPNWRWL